MTYPGFIFKINAVRDPFNKILLSFFPALILGVFTYCIFNVPDYSDKLGNVSIVLLTYLAIADNLRNNLPDISMLTFADIYIISYIMMSLLPMMTKEEAPIVNNTVCKWFVFIFLIISNGLIGYKWYYTSKFLNQTIPT